MSINLIELARGNGIYLLCLPAHTTHILQPLDVGVFKSFKSHFHKACKQYTGEIPGQVVTVDVLASLVGKAWSQSLTPINIMSGFRKCGIYPLNLGQIDDRQLAPSKVFSKSADQLEKPSAKSDTIQFTEKEETLYQKQFEEGYDVPDPKYEAWVSLNHRVHLMLALLLIPNRYQVALLRHLMCSVTFCHSLYLNDLPKRKRSA